MKGKKEQLIMLLIHNILIIQRRILDGVTGTLSADLNANNTVTRQAYGHLKHLSLDGRITLKRILEKSDFRI
jgi:hypothetical protein